MHGLPRRFNLIVTGFLTMLLILSSGQRPFMSLGSAQSQPTAIAQPAVPLTQPQPLTIYQPFQQVSWQGQFVSPTGIAYFALSSFEHVSVSESDIEGIRLSGDLPKLAQAFANLGLKRHLQREYARAIDDYRKGLAIAKQSTTDFELQSTLLGNLALAQLQQDNYSADTIEDLENYLRLIRQYQSKRNADRLIEARALGNLGNAYYGADLYVKALDFHQQRLAIAQLIQDRVEAGKARSDMGLVYQALGNYPKAIAAQQQALTLAKAAKSLDLEATVLGHLSVIYQLQNNSAKAIDYQQRRLAICQQIKDWRGQSESLANLAGLAYLQTRYAEAINLYEQSWKIAWERLQDGTILYRIRGNQGLVYFQMGKPNQALEAYQTYFQSATSRSNRREMGIAKINAAAVRSQSGDLTAAAKALREAMLTWESLRSRLGRNDALKVSIFETQNAPYSNLQKVLVAQNQPEAALEISERSRARAFAELLARRFSTVALPQLDSQPEIPAITLADIQRIAQTQKATLVEYAVIPEMFTVQGRLEVHPSELLIWVVKPTGQVSLRRVDLKPLRQRGVTLAELVQMSRCLSPTPVCRNLEGFQRQPAAASPPAPSVGTSRDAELIEPRSGEPLEPVAPGLPTSVAMPQYPGAMELYQLLIAPIADLLPTDPGDRVIFVPQGSLFLVPFAALQDARGRFLIERHTIAIAPSIQVLELTAQKRQMQRTRSQSKVGQALVVGNPTMPRVMMAAGEEPQPLQSLPGAEREAQDIAGVLKTSALIGPEATKGRVVQQMRQARWIHLATHGLMGKFRGLGLPGAIALGPDPMVSNQPENGLLTATEILDLSLSAELMVLSACDTGRGTITGDGVIGLSRSVIAAGVPSVVVSLWAVSDASTAVLMGEFYRALQQRSDKAQALRQAMLVTMQQYPYPLDWAAFILIGEAA